ncbi:hypothetical protein [Mycobacteroides chelonae]|uniref:hypothetical protein n=1 Tax=Mycobacteroides chelonae TaxID=1774 RepID=UPI0013F4DB2C|nr:hypothetical protein [Mycobacteroides chelonae]
MPVLVTIPGSTDNQGWPSATHYVVDPQAVLHVYNGDKLVTSYKAWDQVVVQDALTLKQNVDTASFPKPRIALTANAQST